MEWLFVLGVSLELAGALVIGAALLLPLLRQDWVALRRRELPSPHQQPTLDDVIEPSYVAVGAVILLTGVTLQLAGYVVQYASGVLIAAAALTAIGACALGLLFAKRIVAPRLLRRAQARYPAAPFSSSE